MKQPRARRLFPAAYSAYKTWIEPEAGGSTKGPSGAGSTVGVSDPMSAFSHLKFTSWVRERGRVISIEPDSLFGASKVAADVMVRLRR